MLTITDGGSLTRALKLPIDLRLKRLLMERRDQLEHLTARASMMEARVTSFCLFFLISLVSGCDPLRTFLTDDYKSLWAFREGVTAATCG